MLRTSLVRSSLLLFTVLLLSGRAAAADEAVPPGPVVGKLHDKVIRFLDGISNGDEANAFSELLVGSQLLEQDGAVRGLVDKSKDIVKRYGAHRESEQVGAKRIGKDVVLLKYLFKCEKFPVVWYFTYYRDFSRSSATSGDDHWVVISVRFDTQVELLSY
ncbi:MAG TPA: hypothetical protein VGZ26_05290 [Pirellulales bacterium]|jgi:hypothetical protein|nr:hypothetical protein [Pirellulales bacterium]